MSRAFLSHSSKQKNLVRNIANNLGKGQCVFDEFEFESGMPILGEILKGLKSTELFVLFISDDSLNSEWVQQEISEAKNILDNGYQKSIYPILIDRSLNVGDDKRIPSWLKKYLLKAITDHFLITKKIKQRLRELSLEHNPSFKAKESLFVGRNEMLDQLESKIYSIGDFKPHSIIVSGMVGIGRRTFLKNALKWVKKIQEFYEPIYITLDTKDSIEDFIIKVQDFEDRTSSESLEQLQSLSFEEKIEEAKSLLVKVKSSNEFIFIIDFGCVIKPSKKVANWYLKLIEDSQFKNLLTLNIVSRFRPSTNFLRKQKSVINFHLNTLSDKDTEKLFVKYLTLLGHDLLEKDAQEVLSILNGVPAQTHYAVEFIHDYGIIEAKKNKQDIIDFGETQVFYLIESIRKKGNFEFDFLVLLSNFEFVSYEILYSIIEDEDKVNNTLEDFYIAGVFDLVGANKEYIKVHYPIADYLKRSKAKLKPEFRDKIRSFIKKFVTQSSHREEYDDISQLLLNVKGAILEGHNLPEKYYIPSFILKTVVEHYYNGKYRNVIKLIDKVLDKKRRLDNDLIREFQYWLCLSLAREKDDRFEIEIQNISGADFYYLHGFYYRFIKRLGDSQYYLEKALQKNPNFQRAKRELVNVKLMKEDYQGALKLAKENYENQKLNAFHIQAYFICLTRKQYLSREDKLKINDLFKNMERSYDFRAKGIIAVMKGEFAYYVEKDIPKSVRLLQECVRSNPENHYSVKALREIYTKCGMLEPLNTLKSKYRTQLETFDV
ncbi:hypothetical protein FUAX_09650 [Fulvitalea axinellae]|uniref:TIR domain-containing protein n=1 Tax=Fulvitalea axinellae TaxID=1182444 RepID=A0AAU9CF45_9BACT|nr:hypothetical protein FUAX_09650 [Fulvitalea axinellae]